MLLMGMKILFMPIQVIFIRTMVLLQTMVMLLVIFTIYANILRVV